MFKELRASIGLLLLFTLLAGVAYPAFVLGVGQILFPRQANGSLIEENGKIIGSNLIGQNFTSDIYFHPRPSAAGDGYDAANSSGSNLAPTSADLSKAVGDRVSALLAGSKDVSVPVDLVTTSASGLDPDISPAAARFQSGRIANARHLDIRQVEDLIDKNVTPPDLGFLGDSRVNVLALNRALDKLAPAGP
jgi:K+-transporting ATPase ATPase C chain